MDEIKGIARVKFHPGRKEEWKRLSAELRLTRLTAKVRTIERVSGASARLRRG
jgi:hypothetical protein